MSTKNTILTLDYKSITKDLSGTASSRTWIRQGTSRRESTNKPGTFCKLFPRSLSLYFLCTKNRAYYRRLFFSLIVIPSKGGIWVSFYRGTRHPVAPWIHAPSRLSILNWLEYMVEIDLWSRWMILVLREAEWWDQGVARPIGGVARPPWPLIPLIFVNKLWTVD